jgi:polar amino acid transport system substrate-binding protein
MVLHRTILAIAASTSLLLMACGSRYDAAQGGASLPADCLAGNLPTLAAGKLTIGTDSPAFGPWFSNDDPTNGEGFESAVAYAVAAKLGFAKANVTWVVTPFANAIAPGVKPFDFDINQVSITDERKQSVDFSSGYYDVNQAIITIRGSKIDGARTIADLRNATLGAQVGTTSYTTLTDVIMPTTVPVAFDNNDIAKQALANGRIDGLIVDLPTAFFITAAELENGVVVGQFANATAGGEQFGLVLSKGSRLTTCVSKAVDALRADGALARIQEQWLAQVGVAPVLQ